MNRRITSNPDTWSQRMRDAVENARHCAKLFNQTYYISNKFADGSPGLEHTRTRASWGEVLPDGTFHWLDGDCHGYLTERNEDGSVREFNYP